MASLAEIGFNKEEDVLICTGDLIDRGEENISCLELMDEPWFYTVEGNHENMARHSVNNQLDRDAFELWFYNGGGWYMNYYATDDQGYVDTLIRRTADLPQVIEVNHGNKKIVVCHADYPSDVYPSNVDEKQVIWSRDRFQLFQDWAEYEEIRGADAFVFGHTTVNRIVKIGNAHYIDAGSSWYGRLFITEIKDELREEEILGK